MHDRVLCSLSQSVPPIPFQCRLLSLLKFHALVVALYCTGWTIWLAVPHTLAGWKNIKSLLDESAFRDIVISIGSTYGLYIIASLLHAEPWHLFTSFLQCNAVSVMSSFVSMWLIFDCRYVTPAVFHHVSLPLLFWQLVELTLPSFSVLTIYSVGDYWCLCG